jgi:hypothetical protein
VKDSAVEGAAPDAVDLVFHGAVVAGLLDLFGQGILLVGKKVARDVINGFALVAAEDDAIGSAHFRDDRDADEGDDDDDQNHDAENI